MTQDELLKGWSTWIFRVAILSDFPKNVLYTSYPQIGVFMIDDLLQRLIEDIGKEPGDVRFAGGVHRLCSEGRLKRYIVLNVRLARTVGPKPQKDL